MKTNRLELLARVRNRIAEEVLRRVMKHADRKALAGVIDPHEVSDAAVETIIASALGSARADYLPTSAAMRETLEKIDQV